MKIAETIADAVGNTPLLRLNAIPKLYGVRATILVKMDGDNQMPVEHLRPLIQAILSGKADYSKANRFVQTGPLQQMPLLRRIGNDGSLEIELDEYAALEEIAVVHLAVVNRAANICVDRRVAVRRIEDIPVTAGRLGQEG